MSPVPNQSTPTLRRAGRWAHRLFWYTIISIIIVTAIVLSLVRLYLPDVRAYREQIEQVASKFLEHEVRIESMDARLLGMTPVLVFKDVHMMGKDGQRELVRFESARLSIDVVESLRAGRIIPRGFTVKGADLAVTRRENGTLLIQGIDIESWGKSFQRGASEPGQGSNELANWLFRRSRLGLEDSDIVWQDFARDGKVMQFRNVNFKLRNEADRHQLTGALTVPEAMGRDVKVAMDIYGNILDPRQWRGKFYVQGFEIDVAHWGIKPAYKDITIHEGKADLRIWGEWDGGMPRSISGEVETYDIKLSSSVRHRPLRLALAGGRFSWHGNRDDWQLNVSGFNFRRDKGAWPSTRISIAQSTVGGSRQWHLYSDYIRVEDVNNLLADSGLLEAPLQENLQELALQGDLRGAHLMYRAGGDGPQGFRIDARFYDLRSNHWQRVPGMRGLSGSVRGSDQAGLLTLTAPNSTFDFGPLFRAPLTFRQLEGTLSWRRDGADVYVHSDSLKLVSEAIRTESAFNLLVNLESKAPPFIDLFTRFSDGKAEMAGRYYPVGIMKDKLVDWLDHALVAGRVPQGGLVLRGRLNDFPFRARQGRFSVVFDAAGVNLNYKPGWPPFEDIDGTARFTGNGMQIEASRARLYDSQIKDTHVSISRFKDPVLSIDGQYQGNTDDFVKFLARSPVGEKFKRDYDSARVRGTMQASAQLSIPLNDRMEQVSPLDYRGEAHLKDSELHLFDNAVGVTGISGTIAVANNDFHSRDLRANILGGPAQLKLFMNQVNNEQRVPQLSMEGEMSMDRLRNIFAVPALDKISGRSSWQALLSAGVQTPTRYEPGFFQFSSDLEGTRLELPPPLEKDAATRSPFFMKVEFSRYNRPMLYSQLGELIKLRFLFDTDEPRRTSLVKGAIAFDQPQVDLPEKEEVRLSGSVRELSLGRWQRIIDKAGDVKSNKPGFTENNLPIVFDFDELRIVTGEEAKTPNLDTPQDSSLLNGEVRSFYIDDMALGHFTIASKRVHDGIEYEKISFDSASGQISGSGTWSYRNGASQTNIVMQMSSKDVGRALRDLGLKAVIEKGKGDIVLQGDWPASPSDFSFEKLDGSLSVSIEKGGLAQVDPGAGRVFGLLSLTELPRRLLLDFSELEKGFKFDLIRGNFNIKNGTAHTDNLFIDSPIALIRIQGDTDLVAQEFDQQVTVIPRVSGTLPVVSGLAWGSQIGALVFLFERLMGSEVDKSVARQYHISGSWEQPDIRRVDKGAGE